MVYCKGKFSRGFKKISHEIEKQGKTYKNTKVK
jgi:hypothetical protein